MHRNLLVGGGQKARPSGQPTAMSDKDDALLDRLGSLDATPATKQAQKFDVKATDVTLASLRRAQSQDMFSRLHEVGALLPLRAKFSMDYTYSSFWEDAEDRIEAIRDQVEQAVVKVDPSLKRKFPKRLKYILKTLVPIIKDVYSSDQADTDLEKMLDHVLAQIKRDIGKLKLEPYLKIDDTKSIMEALEAEAKEQGQEKTDTSLEEFITTEMGLQRVFFLKSPRYILHAMIIGALGVIQLAISFIPYLQPISQILRDEGGSDISFAVDALMKGDCPHIKRWWKNVKLPSMAQTVFSLGLSAVCQSKENGGGWGAFDADKAISGASGVALGAGGGKIAFMQVQRFGAKLLMGVAQGIKQNLSQRLTQWIMQRSVTDKIIQKLHEKIIKGRHYQRNKLKLRDAAMRIFQYYSDPFRGEEVIKAQMGQVRKTYDEDDSFSDFINFAKKIREIQVQQTMQAQAGKEGQENAQIFGSSFGKSNQSVFNKDNMQRWAALAPLRILSALHEWSKLENVGRDFSNKLLGLLTLEQVIKAHGLSHVYHAGNAPSGGSGSAGSTNFERMSVLAAPNSRVGKQVLEVKIDELLDQLDKEIMAFLREHIEKEFVQAAVDGITKHLAKATIEAGLDAWYRAATKSIEGVLQEIQKKMDAQAQAQAKAYQKEMQEKRDAENLQRDQEQMDEIPIRGDEPMILVVGKDSTTQMWSIASLTRLKVG
ncbi:unnamed protein product [Amoebophrya sp. A25]|nr:unnamed protein product [Amoebophrya sp. A25]|eukprot:GSA25T00022141001.1